jgi:hypothetical protein
VDETGIFCRYHTIVVLRAHISHGRRTIGPLVDAVQRRSVTPSTWPAINMPLWQPIFWIRGWQLSKRHASPISNNYIADNEQSAHNVTATYECAVHSVRKLLKLSSNGGGSGNEAMVTPTVRSGGLCFWRESGVWSQAVGMCLWVWQESGFSRHEDIFIFNLFYKKIINFVLSMRFAKIMFQKVDRRQSDRKLKTSLRIRWTWSRNRKIPRPWRWWFSVLDHWDDIN